MFVESASIPSIWASMNSWFTPTVLFVLLNLMIGTILFTSNLANPHQQDEKAQNEPQPPKIARSPSVLQRLRSVNLYPHRSQETPTTHFKQLPDSDTRFPVEEIHPQQTLEFAATQYVFNQTHEQQTLNTETHFLLERTHQQQTLETGTQYVFNPTHEEKSVNAGTQYLIEHTHEEEEVENEEPQSIDEVYSQLTDRHVNRTMSDTQPASGEIPQKLPSKMKKSASLKSAFAHFEEDKFVEARRPATVRERKARVTEEDDVEVDAKADDFINKFKQQLMLQRIDSISRYKDMISRGSAK